MYSAPVGVGRPVISVARPARTEEQALELLVEAVAVGYGVARETEIAEEVETCLLCKTSRRKASLSK